MRACVPRLILILALTGMVSACAKQPPAPTAPAQAPQPAVDISGQIARGCYRCLEEALTRARATQPRQAFEAAVLLALRARELGIPTSPWLDEARALAAGDPALAPFLDIADAASFEPLSGVAEDALLRRLNPQVMEERLAAWRTLLAGGVGSEVFRRYLDVALKCGARPSLEQVDEAAALLTDADPAPILRYRVSLCSPRFLDVLHALRAGDADYADADFTLGRYTLQHPERPDPDAAMRFYASAAAAFPQSTAIAVTIGNLYQTWEDFASALPHFDRALAILPGHPDALIGRTIALSNLGRHEGAIAVATQLIDGKRWLLGQAHYWRAWNHFALKDYTTARRDADRMRALMVNPAAFVLSGLIDWSMQRLETAESDFEEALKIDFGQCDAARFLGGVRNDRYRAEPSLAAFIQARQCYDLSITLRRRLIETAQAGTQTEAAKAREVARHERAIAESERRRAEAISAIEQLEKIVAQQKTRSAPRP